MSEEEIQRLLRQHPDEDSGAVSVIVYLIGSIIFLAGIGIGAALF